MILIPQVKTNHSGTRENVESVLIGSDTDSIMIFLLFIINQNIDFEDFFDKATTSLVQFQAVKDSAFEKLVKMGRDSLLTDTTIDFLISKFDTKSGRERHTLKDIFKNMSQERREALELDEVEEPKEVDSGFEVLEFDPEKCAEALMVNGQVRQCKKYKQAGSKYCHVHRKKYEEKNAS